MMYPISKLSIVLIYLTIVMGKCKQRSLNVSQERKLVSQDYFKFTFKIIFVTFRELTKSFDHSLLEKITVGFPSHGHPLNCQA